jgi:hypothetical protein
VVRDKCKIEARGEAGKSKEIFRRDVGTGANEQDFAGHFFHHRDNIVLRDLREVPNELCRFG